VYDPAHQGATGGTSEGVTKGMTGVETACRAPPWGPAGAAGGPGRR